MRALYNIGGKGYCYENIKAEITRSACVTDTDSDVNKLFLALCLLLH